MPSPPRSNLLPTLPLLSFATGTFLLLLTLPAAAQVFSVPGCTSSAPCVEVAALEAAPAPPSPLLPEAPLPQAPPAASSTNPLDTPITLKTKFTLTYKRILGPPALVSPAVSAAFGMIFPPDHYPREWKDGAAAFGRLYGDDFARNSASETASFVTDAIAHEDPRYFPSSSTNFSARVFHAIAFTLVRRSDSGHNTPALDNFAGSAAAGLVGIEYLPHGFNDPTHAEQRAYKHLATYAGRNLLFEFSPEITRIAHKLHLPVGKSTDQPMWWTKDKSSKP